MGDGYVGNSRIPFGFVEGSNDKYSHGYIVSERFRNDAKFFNVKPFSDAELKIQNDIRDRLSKGHYKSLLVPVIVAQHGNSIIVGYLFEHSFEDWLKSHTKPLFLGKNKVLVFWWRKPLVHLLDTVQKMHKDYMYHGGLSDMSSYVMRKACISIVNPKHPSDSYNAELEMKDITELGSFFRDLFKSASTPTENTSLEWDNFLSGFGTLRMIYLKNHPVFYDGKCRYDYMRILISRIRWQWELSQDEWIKFLAYFETLPMICPKWYEKMEKNSVYQVQYHKNHSTYKLDTNHSFLMFVENAMKHAEEDGLTEERIEIDLNTMFPGLTSILYSLCAVYASTHPEISLMPEENI